MAYDEELAERLRAALGGEAEASEKRMFGGLAFLINGNMAVSASGQGGLLLRCDPAETDELIRSDGGGNVSRFEMRGRAMDGWLRVDTDAVRSESDLRRWVRIGVAYARALPAK